MNQAIAALVRRHDPDRFLTALFAPPEQRDALLTLYAFNHELARAREVVSEPPLALIRLQWWREVVEGAPRRHEVAEPLRAAIDAGQLERDDLLAMIDAREAEAEPALRRRAGLARLSVGQRGRLGGCGRRVCSARQNRSCCGRLVPPMASPACCAACRCSRAQGRCLLPTMCWPRTG